MGKFFNYRYQNTNDEVTESTIMGDDFIETGMKNFPIPTGTYFLTEFRDKIIGMDDDFDLDEIKEIAKNMLDWDGKILWTHIAVINV